MSFRKIAVAVDFSEYSERAVNYALFLAEKYNARLTFLHAIVTYREFFMEVSNPEEMENYLSLTKKNSGEILQSYVKKAARRQIKSTMEIVEGMHPADAILEYLRGTRNDLIVLGTHGHTGLKKWLYGSVAEKIVRMSPIPVLTVHHQAKKPAILRILLPVDFSGYSKKAVKFAIPLAKKFQAHIHFLHVIEQEVHPSFYAGGIDSLFEADPGLKERSLDSLKKFVAYRGENADFTVMEGKAYKEIVNYAAKKRINLIIMATRGVTGLEHLLIGSTTERVVHLAPCPVLTVERK